MKRDLEQKARLLKDENPDEAIKLYREIWDNFNDEFNSWDAFFSIQTLKKSTSNDLDWAFELVEKFPEERLINIFSWLCFDKLVKNKSKQELLANESKLLKMVQIVPQKNLMEDDTFPCSLSISIFKLCELYSTNLFNAKKINEVLSFLDYKFLSKKTRTIETERRGDLELASDYEKYFALKTKALFKLGEFSDCIELCNTALNTIKEFHYNNDTWFKMRIALSQDKLGNHQKGEELLEEILKSNGGSDKWFIYRDISEIYFEQKDFPKAWKFAIEATYYGNEPHFLIGLFLLQAKILYKLNRSEDGKLLAELIAAIIKEQEWNEKQEYKKLFEFYTIKIEGIGTVKDLFSKAQDFWSKERYGNIPRTKGVIISVHGRGKKGRIKDDSGIIVDCHKKDFKKRVRTIEGLKGTKVEFYCIKLISGILRAEFIDIKNEPNQLKNNNLIGKNFKGTVENVVDFGVFVKFNNQKGLIHKNSLSNDIKTNHQNHFEKGQVINVVVDRITEKGFNLKYTKEQ